MQSRAILIADQEEAVRESLQIIMSDEGYRCFSGSRKSEILKILENENINAIILDSQLAIKARLPTIIKERYPKTKMIVISSYAALENIQLVLMDNTDGIILKPLDFDELIELVNHLTEPASL